MLHASTGSSLFSIMRGCSRMSRSVSFASSSSSSSARVRQRRGDWTTVRVHAQQEGNSDADDGTTSDFKANAIVRERDERHGPERFSGHETRGIRDAERSKSGENQIREDEQRALNVATSTDFTKAMLGVTVGLLVLYLLIGPPPIEPPLYNEV